MKKLVMSFILSIFAVAVGLTLAAALLYLYFKHIYIAMVLAFAGLIFHIRKDIKHSS